MVAETVVQALGLSAVATYLVAVVVGVAATGLAWLVGHEWTVAHDPQAIAVGRRSWLGVARATGAAFLVANLAVRVFYGLLAEQADHLGTGRLAPLLAGSLLTVVTTALMVVAAFVTAHAETGKEAELRNRLRRIRAELGVLDKRAGTTDPGFSEGSYSKAAAMPFFDHRPGRCAGSGACNDRPAVGRNRAKRGAAFVPSGWLPWS